MSRVARRRTVTAWAQQQAGELKLIRERYGLNQTQLARAIGVTRETLNRWERGVSGKMSRLARNALNRAVDEFAARADAGIPMEPRAQTQHCTCESPFGCSIHEGTEAG